MAGSEAPPNLKLLLIGNSSVGKSSLLMRFTDSQFLPEDESSATIGVDFRVCKLEVGGRRVKLSIWDTAGQERFRTITSSYYRGAQGIIVAYDISNRETFDALPRWFTELETYVSPSVVKMLVGNKLDKEFSRAVTEDEGRKFAERTGCLFLEASAKTNVGVRETFLELVEKILDTPALGRLLHLESHLQRQRALDLRECQGPLTYHPLPQKTRRKGAPANTTVVPKFIVKHAQPS